MLSPPSSSAPLLDDLSYLAGIVEQEMLNETEEWPSIYNSDVSTGGIYFLWKIFGKYYYWKSFLFFFP